MLDQLLIDLGIGGVNAANPLNSRRKHARRSGVHAEVEMQNAIFQLTDWSRGGFLFETKQQTRFRANDKVSFVMRFFFPSEVIEITHHGEVMRNVVDKMGRFNVGVQFDELDQQVRRELERVIDYHHTEELVSSYAA